MELMKRTAHLGMGEEARLARRSSIGGSDAKIIMSGDQRAIERLWAEKRGEIESEDLSDVLLVQMGNVIEPLNQDWFEKDTGWIVTNEQDKVFHKEWDKAHATLDGLVRTAINLDPFAMLECKFMFPFGFDLQKAIEKYFPQCQHNMMCSGLSKSYLSIITGAAQYYRAEIDADMFYQIELLEAEKKFWDAVESGKTPGTPEIVIPLEERVKIVDMTGNNEWADYAQTMISTKTAADKHEKAKKKIKDLFPADAKEASGYGVKISLSKDGKQMMTLDKDAIKQADTDAGVLPASNDNSKKPAAKKSAKKAA